MPSPNPGPALLGKVVGRATWEVASTGLVDWQDPVRRVVTRDWNSDENTILILTLLRPSLTCDEVAEMYGSEFQDMWTGNT